MDFKVTKTFEVEPLAVQAIADELLDWMDGEGFTFHNPNRAKNELGFSEIAEAFVKAKEGQ